MATNIDKFVEVSEIPAVTGVPVGGIIFWQNPNPASPSPPPPTGYEFCDGAPVTTAGPMFGQTKPDLMVTAAGGTKRIVRGADVTPPYGSGVPLFGGGTDTHAHGESAAGGHSHDMSNHTHAMNSHTHVIAGDTHFHNDVSGSDFFNGGGALGKTQDYAHSHGGATGTPSNNNTQAPSNNNTSSVGGHSHVIAVGSSLPIYVELAYIIRVL